MKTVTFNPLTHKVIALDADTEMTTAFARVFNVNRQKESFNPAYRAMIAAAPDYPADAANPCIDELLSSVKALVACKGRFHTQQNFERLALAYKNFEAGNSASLPPAPEAT